MNDYKTGAQVEGTLARESGAGNTDWIKSIKPNPAKDQITIDFADILPSDAELQVTDYTGRIVKRIALQGNSRTATIDIAVLANGIYNVQLLISNIPQQAKQFSKF